MNKRLQPRIQQFKEPEASGEYLFFPWAVEERILDPFDFEPNRRDVAALAVRNARVPARAGTIAVGNEVQAYDYVPGYMNRNGQLVILPGAKEAVDNKSRRMRLDGYLTLSAERGLVKVVAEAVGSERAPWASDSVAIGGNAYRFYGLEAPLFEIVEIADVSEDLGWDTPVSGAILDPYVPILGRP